jgi:basic membrane protein A and related proteins
MPETRSGFDAIRRRWTVRMGVSLVVALCVGVAGCGGNDSSSSSSGSSSGASSGSSSADKKIGLILAGPKNDQSSNQDVYEKVSAAASKSGSKLSVSESVPPSNSPQIMRSLAQQGYGIVGAMGAEYQKAAEQVAPQFPKTKFVVLYGAPTKVPNVSSVSFDPYSTTYVDGVAAALMSKTGKIGIISGEDSDVFQQLVSGVKQGAASVNKNADVKVVFSGDYSDAQKNKEASQTLIDGGTDVLMGYLDAGAAVMAKTAQSDGKYVVGLTGDMHDIAPKAVITSGITDIGRIMADTITKAQQGDFKGGQQQLFGLKQGYGGVGTFGSFVPSAVQSKVKAAAKGIGDGSITVKEQ